MLRDASARGGDSRAAELYKQYGAVVYRRCLRLLKNPDAARDATQEAFLKLVRNMARLEDRETILPWMYRVATNHCLNVRRDAAARGEDRTVDLEVSSEVSPDVYPARILVQAVLSRFDAATQAIAVAVLVDGMQHEEVAAALGVSRRTIHRKLERFLESAREYLAAEPRGEPQVLALGASAHDAVSSRAIN